VRTIRARLLFLPLPTFTFGVWLTGLILGILLLLALAPLSFRGKRWVLWASFPLAILMFGNGLGHIGGSIYLGHLMPGVYSAPLLLIASAWLLRQAWAQLRANAPGA
jgi:disulfide bond formation protein DsbB